MSFQLEIVLFCASLLVVTVIARPQVWDIGYNPNREYDPIPAQAISDNNAAIVETQPITSTTVAAQGNQDATSPTPVPPPVPVANPFQDYFDCISKCPTTAQYDPICGSDSVNYHNLGRLNCAAGCGVEVTMVRSGTCTTG
ncbi:uncharacterized protein LOC129909401 [Episyrphus balteatus]|uniref:uncharacterized protein LOC129909401 n=1 Tax=Episyrphus balteatus TaxID=286459 RepID=UPI0024850C63|nr:uncharacterized protein LOC129909401 [Episyrphus balteatus]